MEVRPKTTKKPKDFDERELKWLICACGAYIREHQAHGGTGYWKQYDYAGRMVNRLRKMLEHCKR